MAGPSLGSAAISPASLKILMANKRQEGEARRGQPSSAEEPLHNPAQPRKCFSPELISKGNSSGSSLCPSPSPIPPFQRHSHCPERGVEPPGRKRQILTCFHRQREKLKRGNEDGSGAMVKVGGERRWGAARRRAGNGEDFLGWNSTLLPCALAALQGQSQGRKAAPDAVKQANPAVTERGAKLKWCGQHRGCETHGPGAEP